MKIKFILFLFGLIYVLIPNSGAAQNLRLKPIWVDDEFQTEKKYFLSSKNDSIQISLCKFYFSDIELYQKGKLVYKEENSFHLINLNDSLSCSFDLKGNNIQFDEIRMNIGIDSSTNVSGIMGGDLDPVKGMYWTWQSGYIHFKLEGIYYPKFSSEKEITLHLGGYRTPHQTIQQLKFTCSPYHKNYLNLNLYPFINYALKSDALQIMSPCLKAVELSANLTQCIHPE
jgi:hypothetical protein